MELHAVKTFYTARDGLVTLEDDVLSIVRQVRELYGGKVTVSLEPTTGEYVFIEHAKDGTERLIFTTKELDARALERLIIADSERRGYEDPYLAQEREQDLEMASRNDRAMDYVRDAGERLAWAIGDGKFGPGMHQSISTFVPKKGKGSNADLVG